MSDTHGKNQKFALDWAKINAIVSIAGIVISTVIGLAGLWLTWKALKQTETQPGVMQQVMVTWWMPVLIAVCLILTGLFFYRGLAEYHRKSVQTDDPENMVDTPPAPFDAEAYSEEDFPVTRKRAEYDQKRDVPLKVYVELVNNTSTCIEVKTSRWLSGIKGDIFTQVWQLWLDYAWFPQPHGIATLHVPPGERFRFWVAPDHRKYSADHLQQLCDTRDFGTAMIRVNGQERGIIL